MSPSLTQIQAQIAELRQQEAVATAALHFPEIGQTYYYLEGDGTICSRTWEQYNNDGKVFNALGNLFCTREHAEMELQAHLTIAEFRLQVGNKDFAIGEDNWSIEINTSEEIAVINQVTWYNGFGYAYFDTEANVLAAIATVGNAKLLEAAKWLATGVSL